MPAKPKIVLRAKVEGLDDLKKAFQELERAERREVLLDAAQAGAKLIHAEANRRAPAPHIEMRNAKMGAGGALVEIGPDKEHWYYRFIETGAQRHEIKGKGKPLVFDGRQGVVVTPKVDHPGMEARPFLRPALDMYGEQAQQAAGEVIKNVMLEVANG
jgi:HK97 gp10 family phage protein